MTKITTKATFKQQNQNQLLLLPPSLEELIPKNDLCRVVNKVIDQMDLSDILNLYKGGGTSSYHPRLLLKILLYGYSVKIYSGRKIAQALKQNINFMWLAGMSKPDFRTINNFRSSKAKEVIELLFTQMLEFLMETGHIKYENYFCDGTTIVGDGNKHKMVWKKNAERYKEQTKEKCKDLFKQIESLNANENKIYGNKDLECTGSDLKEINEEEIKKQVEKLNETISKTEDKTTKRIGEKLKKEVTKLQDKIGKYDRQIDRCGPRSGYNKTDIDATAMMMKNKVEILPAYNVLAGSENQYITGVSIHQNTNDGRCFQDHIEQIKKMAPKLPKVIVADAIFGTEQNYNIIEELGIENYMKFQSFQYEQTKKHKENKFAKENFKYDTQRDVYTCPNERELHYIGDIKEKTKSGFETTTKKYECEDCSGCPFYEECCKSMKGKKRSISINENLDRHKAKARENLHSERGKELRSQRCIEIESCFGDIKHNMKFRRFHLRGKAKVYTEMILVSMAHNVRKLHIDCLQKVG